MPATARPAVDPGLLRRRLAALRRRLRLVAGFRGACWLFALVVGAAVAAALLDWRWHLPGLVRAVALAATLAGGGLVALRYLVRPLAAPADDLALALRIEEQFPGLNDALASTVEFLHRPGSGTKADSASLRREAIRRALGAAAGLDFGRVIDRDGLRAAALAAAVAAAALAAALVLMGPPQAATAALRLADPFGRHDWPRQTQIEVEPPRARIGRNEPFEVRARLRGVLPERAAVTFRFDDQPGAGAEHSAEVKTEDGGTGRLVTRLDPSRVQRSFRFQVRANDAVSDEYEVAVMAPPVLVPLGPDEPSPHVHLFFPAYTGLPSPLALPPGTGNVEAVAGTAVSLRARADRPLARAWVEFQPEARFAPLALGLAPLGTARPSGALASLAGGAAVWGPVDGRLDADRCTFAVDFLPRLPGMYALHFEDETGLANSRLFELRVQPDPSPAVQLERPAPGKDLLTVLPDAELPLHVVAEDPVFALRSVYLEYRVGRQGPPQALGLHDPAGARLTAGAAAGSAAAGGPARRPTRLEFRRALPLKDLRRPDGGTLQEGDLLLLQACADDFDDVTVNKPPGRSHEVEIRIVGKNALDLALNQEQARVQQELLRLREKEREAMAKSAEAEKGLAKREPPKPEDLDALLQAEQLQQQIREQAGTPDKEGLRARVGRILEALRQNRMEHSAARDRMGDVARELDRLSANELGQIEARLAEAHKHAELPEEGRADPRAEAEARAREAERQAREAEDRAREQDRAADDAEVRADEGRDGGEKATLREQAKQGRRQAERQRQKARELLQEAARARREAAAAKQNPAAEALGQARKHQEEVERTLSDLLSRLEPWSDARQVRGEAGRILEDQRKLEGQADELRGRKDLQGKRPDELNEEQRRQLDELRDAQGKLAERTERLLGQMDGLARDRREKDPDTARLLDDARRRAAEDNIAGQMKEARDAAGDNRLNRAREQQRGAAAGLERLVKGMSLDERREEELDRLARKLREAEKELAGLIDEQERLEKKVKEAGQIDDPERREQELQTLQRRQQELKERAEQLLQQLSRQRAGRAGQALGRAGERMEQARRQMAEGQQADEPQEEALDRLEEALDEVEQAREQAEDELDRERRVRAADALKRLRERQESLNAEAARLQELLAGAVRDRKWVRKGAGTPLRASLLGLAENQNGLGQETADAARKELTGTPVFARLVQRSAEAMAEAGRRVDELTNRGRQQADTLPDAELGRLQQEALRRLDQVLAALKEDEGRGPRRSAAAGGGGGGSGGGGEDDGIPPTAQLKLLQALQRDINKRTEAFAREHPDPDRHDDKERAELKALQRDQQDVAELLEEFRNPPEQPAPGDDRPREPGRDRGKEGAPK
jgi:hypothetical protein